ncbi:peptidoglycan-binding domain-containing protein [Pseudobacteroides cellulosolvens]|uniref:Peptidoglycan-binding domain 1 protein n=1 Tax=Pseudobacteroides cellulosolvens ATCC 35603 = DSM 2933 TaxID=398512 RepID=A0A0L6JSZ6_9FIRM|nr:peptidoglycan-binding domain-containing protein [Pseudobacteroides cellulosolvens]KNY28547.1 Peptidoglycan-binding domain 1 protein [Pseudobacteroides cellulosolvens ATCC 35603 = DSM 2933]
MISSKALVTSIAVIGLSAAIYAAPVNASASSLNLHKGSRGAAVTTLQNDLRKAGFFNAKSTGYFGSITKNSVLKLQKKYGLKADGIVGAKTFKAINDALSKVNIAQKSTSLAAKVLSSTQSQVKTTQKITSRAGDDRTGYLIPWFGGVEEIFARDSDATVFDIETGMSFNVKRSYGYNHADCEPLTERDTEIMKNIYGGQWSWSRRAVIVTVNGMKIPGSMAGMPHAGLDSAGENAHVGYRSGGYGAGTNLDKVKGNAMNGHFDIHFYNSKTHGSNKVDKNHQNKVSEALRWLEGNR